MVESLSGDHQAATGQDTLLESSDNRFIDFLRSSKIVRIHYQSNAFHVSLKVCVRKAFQAGLGGLPINFRCWEARTQGGFNRTPLHIDTIQASAKGMVGSGGCQPFAPSANEGGNAERLKRPPDQLRTRTKLDVIQGNVNTIRTQTEKGGFGTRQLGWDLLLCYHSRHSCRILVKGKQ